MKYERLNPNIKDADGHTALTWAADKGYDEIVEMLLSLNDIDINSKVCDLIQFSWIFFKNFIPIQDNAGENPFLVATKKSVGVVRALAEDDRTEVNVQVRFHLCLSL